jgi:hypothetical protein
LLKLLTRHSVSLEFKINAESERLDVLAILSHELFVEVKKRSEDDLSKQISSITAVFRVFVRSRSWKITI